MNGIKIGTNVGWVRTVFYAGEIFLSYVLLILASVYFIYFSVEAPGILLRYYSGGGNEELFLFVFLPFVVLGYFQWYWRKLIYPHLRAQKRC